MQQYEKYKPSEVEWIGYIPENWNLTRLKYLGSIETGGKNTEDRVEEGEYPFYVRSQKPEKINSYSFDGEAILTAGDGVGVAKVFHYYNGKFDFHQRVYKISDFQHITGKYLFYYLQANLYKEVLKWNAKSTVDSLRLPMFQNFLVAYPQDLDEQRQISTYIDTKISEIDNVIFKKQQLITILKEERNVIIDEAISGKEKSWPEKKLKYVANINRNKPSFQFDKKSDEQVVFLPMEKISEEWTIDQEIRKKISDVNSGFTYFERGDIIVAKITPCFENGKAALLSNLETDFGFGSTEFHTLTPTDAVIPEYLLFITRSERFMKVGEAFMTGSAGQKRVPSSFIENFVVGIPDKKEQQQIVDSINKETLKIDATISKIETEIQLIQEYRTALISEVVTGKIKVV